MDQIPHMEMNADVLENLNKRRFNTETKRETRKRRYIIYEFCLL